MSSADRIEIMGVQNAYGVAIDARRWDWFQELFTADVQVEYRRADGSTLGAWTNRDTFLASFVESHKQLSSTQHMMLSHLATVDGEQANAFCYGYVKVIYAPRPTDLLSMTSYYDDELIHQDGRWRISKRTFQETLYREISPVPADTPIICVETEVARDEIAFLRSATAAPVI